jgi:hypothetical protein
MDGPPLRNGFDRYYASWGDHDQARGGKMGTGRSSLDHFIGLGEQRRRHHQADGLLIPSARGWNTAN